MLEKNKGLRTWIDIDTSKLKSNVEAFRALIKPNVKLMGVVKSNAYGHGLVEISQLISTFGVDSIAVDSIVEGIKLREEGITIPILVLGYTLPEMIQIASEKDITLSVSHIEHLNAIQKAGLKNPIKIHIKADTGLNRQGFSEDEIDTVISTLKDLEKNKKIILEGLFTHFASAKDPNDREYTNNQIASFENWRVAFKDAGFKVIAHACATGGTILFPEAHYDMVRVGIGLYGLWPSKETEAAASGKINLQPILTWKTLIGETKKVSSGSKIGYDGTEILSRDSVIAICPVGYWHGYPRSLSSKGEVVVNNPSTSLPTGQAGSGSAKAKVLGRVSMDMIIIDVTDIPNVKIGDEVELIGPQITAQNLAKMADGSYYELLTRINPLIRKHYLS